MQAKLNHRNTKLRNINEGHLEKELTNTKEVRFNILAIFIIMFLHNHYIKKNVNVNNQLTYEFKRLLD